MRNGCALTGLSALPPVLILMQDCDSACLQRAVGIVKDYEHSNEKFDCSKSITVAEHQAGQVQVNKMTQNSFSSKAHIDSTRGQSCHLTETAKSRLHAERVKMHCLVVKSAICIGLSQL